MTTEEALWDVFLFGQSEDTKALRGAGADADREKGFWGPPTGIDWCEPNYAVSVYVAEFWNTVTNVAFIVLALRTLASAWRLRLPLQFRVASYALFCTGLASAFFHATLWLVAQRLDEFFENSYLLVVFHSLSQSSSIIAISRIAIHATIFGLALVCITFFLVCEVHLIGMAIALMYRTAFLRDAELRRRARFAWLVFLVAGLAWLLDRMACAIVQPLHLHAAWHLLTAVGLHEIYMVAAAIELGKGKDFHALQMKRNFCLLTTLQRHTEKCDHGE